MLGFYQMRSSNEITSIKSEEPVGASISVMSILFGKASNFFTLARDAVDHLVHAPACIDDFHNDL